MEAARWATNGGLGRHLLPRLPDLLEQLLSAIADFEHLRDSIAGRLDRLSHDHRLRGTDKDAVGHRSAIQDATGDCKNGGEAELGLTPAMETGGSILREVPPCARSVHLIADAAPMPKRCAKSKIGCDSPRLSEAESLAWRQFTYARNQNPEWSDRQPDRSVHEWLVANEPDLPADVKPLQKNFETWSRYVRSVRNAAGSQKNKPRPGRTSRSAVPASAI